MRFVALLALVASLGILPSAPARAHGLNSYQDCGLNNDTGYDNRHEMYDGEDCHGYLNYDNWDYYSFHPTLDDYVTASFTQRSECIFGHVFGPSGDPHADTGGFDGGGKENGFTASRSLLGEGTQEHTIYIHRNDFEPDYDTCNYSSGWEYTIHLEIVPNDRPTVSILSAPSRIEPGQNVSFTIRADDVDGNLKQIGMRVGSESTWQPASGATGTKTFTTSFLGNGPVSFLGEDFYGATGSAIYQVVLSQNDCGSGTDAANYEMQFPGSCRGYLSSSYPDASDTYLFDVPNSIGRVRASYSIAAGDLSSDIVLTSPSGVTFTATDQSLFADAEGGTWTAELQMRSGQGLYDLSVSQVGDPAAPSVSASANPTSIHQGDIVTLAVSGSDPNNERLRFRIDWGDGSTQWHPSSSGMTSSPTTFYLQHRYVTTATSVSIAVTATNEENLSATTTTPSIPITPHNDCGFGLGFDAAPTYTVTTRELPASCIGELGYTNVDGTWDVADVYKVTHNSFGRLRIQLQPISVSARLSVYYFGTEVPAGIIGGAGVYEQPVSLPGTYRVFVRWAGGRGGYSLQVTK